MTGGITVALVRRLIVGAPWAQARLRPFAGQLIEWDIAGLTGRVQIDGQGLPARAAPDAAADAAVPAAAAPAVRPGRSTPAAPAARQGVRLTLAAADLPAIGQGMDALMRGVNIEGNAGLAGELAFIVRHLQPDPAEWLAPWLGDVLAERAGRGLRSSAAWAAGAGRRTVRAGARFAVEDARLLPDSTEVSAHCRAVDEVREAVDRLAQRIARLEQGGLR